MSILPKNHLPQKPIDSPSNPQNPGQTPQNRQSNAGLIGQSQSFQGQSQSPPQVQVQPSNNAILQFGTTPPSISMALLPCCGCPDIKLSLILLGIIHLIFQLVVFHKYAHRFASLQGRLDKYRYREDARLKELGWFIRDVREYYEENGSKEDVRHKIHTANELELEAELDFREIYLEITVYSAFNAAATFAFICLLIIGKGGKATFLVCYIVGPILNSTIIGLYSRIVPGRADVELDTRSMIFNSSVVIAVIYHACGFVLICSMISEPWSGKGTRFDLETVLPVEIYPTGNPSVGIPGFQQQYPNVATATGPSIHQRQ